MIINRILIKKEALFFSFFVTAQYQETDYIGQFITIHFKRGVHIMLTYWQELANQLLFTALFTGVVQTDWI